MPELRYLLLPGFDPAFNLAAEQYVFDALPRDRSYLLLWQNDRAVIVGKYQNTLAEINKRYVDEQGIRVVRRLSGGGAVYHDLGNLNYTFILDAANAETLDLQLFCLPVVRALEALGLHAELNGRNDNVMRERTRLHHDLIPFADLPHAEVLKDSEPMLKMLELIREFEGLSIYRM